MPHPKRKPSYEELRDVWYAKLKMDGFEDIEQDEDALKKYTSTLVAQNAVRLGGWRAKAAYYSMCDRFLNEYKFDSTLDQIVWEYHANGMSKYEIVKILKKAKISTLTQGPVYQIIKRLRIKMYSMYMEPKRDYHE
jgi:hypothetical protein